MTVPQILMLFFGCVAIACFVISWLILTHEDINKKANRMAYNASVNWERKWGCLADKDHEKAPKWADIAKYEETKL